jgi:hypothetical protein
MTSEQPSEESPVRVLDKSERYRLPFDSKTGKKINLSEYNTLAKSVIKGQISKEHLPKLLPKSDSTTSDSKPAVKPVNAMLWSKEKVEYLLDLLSTPETKNSMAASKSTQQMKIIWSKLTFKFNSRFISDVDAEQFKEKYRRLKRSYNEHRDAMALETGNKTAPPEPEHYDLLVGHFGDKSGMGSNDFGQSQVTDATKTSERDEYLCSDQELSFSDGSSNVVRSNKRKLPDRDNDSSSSKSKLSSADKFKSKQEVVRKIREDRANRRNSKTTNISNSAGMAQLGEKIAEGMIVMSQNLSNAMNPVEASNNIELTDYLKEMTKGQKDIVNGQKEITT